MNIHTLTPSQRLWIEAHKARRAAWERKAATVRQSQPVMMIAAPARPLEAKTQAKFSPQWLVFPTQFNAHVIAFRRHQVDIDETAIKKTMKEICIEVLRDFPCVSLDVIKSRRRDREVVEARQMCMYEIKKQQPSRTTPEMAKFFCLNHTVVLHGITKMKAEIEGHEESIERLARKRIRNSGYQANKRAADSSGVRP